MDWYLGLFAEAGNVKYAGESSVSYTAVPWVTGCHERIHRFNPDARLIYIMRDPIERSISHYWHFVADGREDLGMLEAIRRREEYIARSHYARQLRPYIETFGASRVFALTLEELNRSPADVFARLFAFLGLDPVPIDTTERHNVSDQRVRQTRRGFVPVDTFLKHWRLRPLLQSAPGAPFARALRAVAYRTVDRRDVDTAPVVRYLRPIVREQTRELEALLGRTFADWPSLRDHEDVSKQPQTEAAALAARRA
jgi:hypothetical protein